MSDEPGTMEQETPETSEPIRESLETRTPEVVTWTIHPARKSPLKLVGTALVMAVTALGVLVVDGDLVMALVSVMVLTVAAGPFLFPTRFSLSQRGIERRTAWGLRTRTWATLRRWQEDRHGILVSPYRNPSLLDDLRGIYLRGGPREQVRAVLLARLGPASVLPGSRRKGGSKVGSTP